MRLMRLPAEKGVAGGHLTTLSELTSGQWTWALISNYLLDPIFLWTACPALLRCPVVLFMSKSSAPLEKALASGHGAARVVYPPVMDRFGTHHSKFFLLFAEKGIRVIIHTANLLFHDCSRMTQGVWSQDFPLKGAESPPASQFEHTLEAYLHAAWGEGGTFLKGDVSDDDDLNFVSAKVVRQFDFSQATAHLIASIPGRFQGAERNRWGHPQMAHLLAREEAGWDTGQHGDKLVCQFSSFSSLGHNNKFLTEMATCMSSVPRAAPGPVLPMSLVWPTTEQVRCSHIGYGGGSSMPSRVEHVDRAPVKLLAKWATSSADPFRREAVTPHLKTFLRYSEASGHIKWLALTSSNFSMAAWGSLERNGSQVFIKSYELGVLITPQTLARGYAASAFDCTRGANLGSGWVPKVVRMCPMKSHDDGTRSSRTTRCLSSSYPSPFPFPRRSTATATCRGRATAPACRRTTLAAGSRGVSPWGSTWRA